MKENKTTRPRVKIEDVVSYALGHRIRVQVLTVVNEGTFSADEIAKIIGEEQSKVHHNIRQLLEGGSIEL